jgi:hypothetical protein
MGVIPPFVIFCTLTRIIHEEERIKVPACRQTGVELGGLPAGRQEFRLEFFEFFHVPAYGTLAI